MDTLYTNSKWGYSPSGKPIPLFASSPIEQLTQPILWIGGVHGDEPEGVELAEKTLEWLKKNPNSLICPWILIPKLNIDGCEKNQRQNGNGVDLNRNYPSKNWSAQAANERYIPGSGPGSEPEVQSMVQLINKTQPRLIVHCHSWHPCIIVTGKQGLNDGERLANASGYELKEDIGYPTPGSLSEYAANERGIPVICVEERSHLEDLSTVWPRFAKGVKAIFKDTSMRK